MAEVLVCLFLCTHSIQYLVSPWCRQEFNIYGMSRRRLPGSRGCQRGCRGSVSCSSGNPGDGGCCVWLQQDSTTRLQGQGTRDYGCPPLECDKYDVTCRCMLESIAPLSLTLLYYFFFFVPPLSLAHKHPRRQEQT